ncbi:serine/threonine-protein kinase [Piscinibacter defluvii]|uniref:serine/threonine-protein kinase n=1 Tax=Piscinibacter defluvii TaxID=1796922 RepID=UPI000FDD8CD0|nr:serine/threonine-protein kinase [Piscinibacter defluvii]
MNRLDLLAPRWAELSALLDEALALPAAQREAWLQALPETGAGLRDTLRELLAAQAGIETGDFLHTLPRLDAPAAPPDIDEPAPGRQVGPYRLVQALGQGGMGSVWLAERADGQLKRRVALKLPRLAWGAGLAQRLARERDILASLEHPHIARLYDAGVDEHGRPFFAMEWVDGRPLDAWCAARGADLPTRVALLLQVCDAVAHAHARLVVHRDLKPGNILVTEQGEVRLLDFGIAKLLEDDAGGTGALTALVGAALTPDYASPEQIAGAPLTTASDVYSLGVVAYELLAGARPYRLRRGSAAELEEAIAAADPPRASSVAPSPALRRALRGDLDAILEKALAKSPAQRYASVTAFADDLRRHARGEPVQARPAGRLLRARKFVVRHRLGVGAAVAVLLALLAGTGVSLWQAGMAQREARRAQAVQAFVTDIFRANTDAQPDPETARRTTARELLDIGAQRLQGHLRSDPEGRAEVLGLLGGLYYDLGLDEQSAALYGQRAAALQEALGPRDARVARALVEHARQLDQLGRDDEQQRALDEAQAILDGLRDHDSATRAALLDTQGLAALHDGPRATALASAAVDLYRRHHPDDPNFPFALNRLGNVLWNSDRLAEAEAAFVESLDRLDRQPNPGVSARLSALLTLAHIQWLQSRLDASEATYRRALALTLERNGSAHVDTLHTQSRFAWLLHRTGRRDEAWQLMDAATATLAAGRYTPHPTRSVRTHHLQMLLAEGRFEEAATLADWVVAEYRTVAGGRNALLVACLRLQAEQRLGLGRLAEAEAALAEAQALMRELDPGQLGPVANPVHMVAARLALRRQQPEAALQALARIEPRAGLPAQALQPELLRAQAVRAEALLAQGQPAAARAAAQQVLERFAAFAQRERLGALEAEALLPLGQALRREGRSVEACALFDAARRLRLAAFGERSPLLGEVDTARAGCAEATAPSR